MALVRGQDAELEAVYRTLSVTFSDRGRARAGTGSDPAESWFADAACAVAAVAWSCVTIKRARRDQLLATPLAPVRIIGYDTAPRVRLQTGSPLAEWFHSL